MSKIDNGGPAFPLSADNAINPVTNGYGQDVSSGLTKRDYFAAAALPALIARHRADVPWRQVVPLALELADAMIAASRADAAE
jgi:hypothetical protein